MTVTPLYAGLLGTLFLDLTFRVIRFRRGSRVDMGDAGDPLLRLEPDDGRVAAS